MKRIVKGETFALAEVKYIITQVFHLTTGEVTRVKFKELNHQGKEHHVTIEYFNEKAGHYFEQTGSTATDLKEFYSEKRKQHHEHPQYTESRFTTNVFAGHGTVQEKIPKAPTINRKKRK